MRSFIQEYIQALSSQNDGINVVRTFVKRYVITTCVLAASSLLSLLPCLLCYRALAEAAARMRGRVVLSRLMLCSLLLS